MEMLTSLVRLRDARLSAALALTCLLAGCGGEGSSTASTTASPTGDAPSATAAPASTGFAAAVTSMTPAGGGTVPAKASATVGTPPRAEAQGAGGNVSLTWQAPTENTDGSALQNLGGYIIHYGTASKQYTSQITITNPGLTTYVVESLPAGTYYFSMTATTSAGVQSSPSSEAHTTIS
jgi:hypothetical protein